METGSRTHLSEEEVANYIAGALTEGSFGEVVAHVDECASCRRCVADAVRALRDSKPTLATDEVGPGTVIGRYLVRAVRGAGGMGRVFEALDPVLGRTVALKIVHNQGGPNDARALREGRALAKLAHPSIVRVYDVGTWSGGVFLAMELVSGVTLREWVNQPRPWREVVRVFADIASGLAAVHDTGLVHRDIKPDNMIIDDSGRARVIDFGLAIEDASPGGSLSGTLGYLAPEQLDSELATPRSDQYAFAVALYETLEGRRPAERPEFARTPGWVRKVIARGLTAAPQERFRDMAAVARALERGLGRRRRAIIGTALVGTAALAVVLWETRSTPVAMHRLFGVPMRARFAMSPDASRLAIGTEHLEVRTVDGTAHWTALSPTVDQVEHLELAGDRIRFSLRNARSIWHWDYAAGDRVELEAADAGGLWLGDVRGGRLVVRDDPESSLAVIDGTHEVARWPVARGVRLVAVSPDGERVAHIEAQRFDGAIVVHDIASGKSVRSPVLASPTSLTWRDDHELIYATGTLDHPRIQRVAVGDSFGDPVEVAALDSGWFGQLFARGDSLFAVELHPISRTRIAGAAGGHDFDQAAVTVALGWTSEREMLAWSRSTLRVELRTPEHTVRLTPVVLESEPANATIAGDLVIAALRFADGRELVARSLADGRIVWRDPGGDRRTLAVRCAGDRQAPCFAIRAGGAGDPDQVVAIDPRTGAFGARIVAGRIEDIAVSEDGAHLLLAGPSATPAQYAQLREVDATGTTMRTLEVTGMHLARSVAYASGGDIIVAGSGETGYTVVRLHEGALQKLAESDNDLTALVRPSPDGAQVLYVARGFAPELWQLPLR